MGAKPDLTRRVLKRTAATALLVCTTLAACEHTGGLSASGNARNVPFAANGREQGVDGLLVGHRLMEAGEYELAMRAYYRAAAEQGMNADVLSAIGSADLKLGRLGQAEQVLRRAIEADETNVPALNNLGCVLIEQGKVGEARRVFQQAFALDSGQSDSIRENLKLAIARSETALYDPAQDEKPVMKLVRRGQGSYVLLSQL
ncbi:MAG: tetratricopeptide repeat protein [Cypionkella sp.]|uniref:tetratricopeptide repeat protein n=1 Tax=Cypionkella sp. TaxID=2811411 RepID=UPI002608FDE9|nr:tetratricopeptide repeat protein [Cypionkella sp.]MDB5660625.1 tetratricopeptide repeat protein [Cypionkella sp.]